MTAYARSDQFGSVDAWARQQGHRLVAGVDEVGRGAMAGPLVAGAVILPDDRELSLVGDSKLMTPAQREQAFEEIKSAALAWAVGIIEPEVVDRINVLRATWQAMREALAALDPQAEFVLVDGLPVRGLPLPHRAVVGGDALSPSIGAGSIVAKVVRDRVMERLDLLHRGYGLAENKGYCTPGHCEAVDRLGPSPVHRRSFSPVYMQYEQRLPFDDDELRGKEE